MTLFPSSAAEEEVSTELPPFIVIRRTTLNYIAIAGVFLVLGIVIGAFSAFKVERENRSWVTDALSQALADNADTFAGLVASNKGPSLSDRNSHFDVSAASDFFIGRSDAPVELVEFGDYNCTFCRRFQNETLDQITSTFGDNVRYVFRDFPILGDSSVLAAMAARCAGDQDPNAFWSYHDILYANQGVFLNNSTAYTRFAAQLNLDTDAFDACMADRRHLPAVQDDYNAARSYGITGTPAFFINGRPIIGAQPFGDFAGMIAEELQAKGVDTSQFDLPSILPETTISPTD